MCTNNDMTIRISNYMTSWQRNRRQRSEILLISWILILGAFTIISCGDGSTPSSGRESTGAISFTLELEKAGGNVPGSAAATKEAVPQICTDQGLQRIYAEVQGSTGTVLRPANWPCEVGSGTIESVPVGSNYTLQVDGRDSGGIIKVRGEKTGVEVLANTMSSVKITLTLVNPVCPTGQQLVGNTCVPITCPTGQQLVGNTCQPIICPTGQQLVGNTCEPIICPTGWRLVGNVCQPLPSNQLWNIETSTGGKITATHSGLYLAVDSTGKNVSQLSSSYNWRFVPSGSYVQIISNTNDKCLDVESASLNDQANVQVFTCVQGDHQLWSLNKLAEGYTQIINKRSNKCLDVAAASTSPGANVQQFTCR